MANYYWIKLFIEILDDPKMGQLTEHQWNCAIKLFLLAGDMNKSGLLPSVSDMAWRLRCSVEAMENDLADLAAVNITQPTDTGWIVTNFSKRQDRISGADRIKAYRERLHKEQYYGNDVVTSRYTDKDIDKESDIDKIIPALDGVPVSKLPKRMNGDVSKVVMQATKQPYVPDRERIEQIDTLLDYYGYDDVLAAFKDAYKRWTSTPRKDKSGNYSGTNFKWVDWAQDYLAGNRPPPKDPSQMTDDEYKAWLLQGAEND